MATKSVDAIDIQDRIDDLAHKAIGILQVMERVSTDEVLPKNAVSGASWAVADMVREIQKLATRSEA